MMEDQTQESSSELSCYNIVLFGKLGIGKSATGNTILGKKAFHSAKAFKAVTQEIQKSSGTIADVSLHVYDTPGFFDPETPNEEIKQKCQALLQLDESLPTVFLLVIKADRFTSEDIQTVEMIDDYLLDWQRKNTWILFTRGDELEEEGITIEQFTEDSEELRNVLSRFQNQYHVFNNKTKSPQQVIKLIEKIKACTLAKQPVMEPLPRTETSVMDNTSVRRIVLLGKTGVGKSATGNTILQAANFRSESSFSSVTQNCEKYEAKVAGRTVSVVDTPGFFDSKKKPKDIAEQIGDSVYKCSPGPHAFLYVVSLKERFIHVDEEVIQKIELIFGKDVAKYTIPLFTHADQLEGKSVDKLIKQNKTLRKFVERCGGRYQIFNNKDKSNKKQVTDLLQEIDRMVENNGRCCYSNQMFKDAETNSWSYFFQKYKNKLIGAAIGLVVGAICGGCVGFRVCGLKGAVIGILLGGLGGAAVGAVAPEVPRWATHAEKTVHGKLKSYEKLGMSAITKKLL